MLDIGNVESTRGGTRKPELDSAVPLVVVLHTVDDTEPLTPGRGPSTPRLPTGSRWVVREPCGTGMGETHLEAGHGRPGCEDERWESRPEELVSSLSSRQTVLAAPPTWWLTERELPGWFGLDVERHKLQCP